MRLLIALLAAGCSFSGNKLDQVPSDAAPDSAIDAAVPDAADPPDPLADCTGLDDNATADQTLTDGGDLLAAVGAAGSGDVIELGAGNYTIDATVLVTVDDLTIRGSDRLDPTAVTVTAGTATTLLDIQGSGFTIGNLTLVGGDRQIIASGSASADEDGFFANNIVSRDAGISAIVVAGINQLHTPVGTDHFMNDGLIICSQFRPSASCDNDIGVVIRDSNRWRVSKNSFTDYDCVGSSGVEVRDAVEPVIDRNFIRRYTDGIRVGSLAVSPRAACDAAGTDWSVLHGVVCNNDLFEPATSASAGLFLAQACETVVVHNTIHHQGDGPAIRATEANSLLFAGNNLSNADSEAIGGAVFDASLLLTNQLGAPDAAFSNPTIGVLTPVPGSTRSGSSMMTLSPLLKSFCDTDRQGRPRDIAMPAFVGAYED